MTAISIRQPWASLIAAGIKTLEVRSWQTQHRGDLLICASSSSQMSLHGQQALGRYMASESLPRGVSLAIVNLVNCRHMELSDEKAACCPYEDTMYVWELTDVRQVAPVRIAGKLRLFEAV